MSRVAVLPSLIVLVGACDDTAVRQPPSSCEQAVDHSDLEWIQENVFTPSCSKFSACHQRTATQAAGLNLEAGRTAMNLIGAVSRVCGEPQILVVPGEPENSYLMKVLGNYDLPAQGSADCPLAEEAPETMPYNSALLCREKRDAIERWIVDLASMPDAGVTDDASAAPDADLPDAAVDAASSDAG